MKQPSFFCAFLVCILCGFTGRSQNKITVAVAANMQFAMEQLKTEFEKETGVEVNTIVSSSGKLSAQVMEGAPFDVFVSADMKYPQELYRKGFATAPPKVYASGQLVLWTVAPGIALDSSLAILLSPAVKKIALPNPQTAPYGVAAEEVLKYHKIYEKVKDKLVYGESIGQASQFIASQSAEVGFVAKSLVLADELKGRGTWIDLDSRSYAPILQGAVILKHGKETNEQAANRFYGFLYSEKAKLIFKKYGYLVTYEQGSGRRY